MKKKQLIIIIPARKNSISIKNKNLFKVNKKPLIEYSFIIAKKISEFSKIIHCSTDSKQIQKIAKKYRINAQPTRPKAISKIFSRDLEFVNYTLNIYKKKNLYFKYGLILRPTNPARSVKNLNKSYNLFKKNKSATSLKSIFPCSKTPYKTWTIKKKFLKPVIILKSIRESYNAPRQKLPLAYNQTGTYEYFRINYRSKLDTINGKKILPFLVEPQESIDIDEINDFKSLKVIK